MYDHPYISLILYNFLDSAGCAVSLYVNERGSYYESANISDIKGTQANGEKVVRQVECVVTYTEKCIQDK